MPRQVLRWDVPVDDQMHSIGSGPVVNVDSRGLGVVEVWTDESEASVSVDRMVQVYGTGHIVPDIATHLGSTLDGGNPGLVWHLFQLNRAG